MTPTQSGLIKLANTLDKTTADLDTAAIAVDAAGGPGHLVRAAARRTTEARQDITDALTALTEAQP